MNLSLPNLRHYPSISLEELAETTNSLDLLADLKV